MFGAPELGIRVEFERQSGLEVAPESESRGEVEADLRDEKLLRPARSTPESCPLDEVLGSTLSY